MVVGSVDYMKGELEQCLFSSFVKVLHCLFHLINPNENMNGEPLYKC